MDLLINNLAERCLKSGIGVHVSAEMKRYLIDKYVNLQYGARPLKRAVQSEIEDIIAEQMLEGKVLPGDEIEVQIEDGEVKLSVNSLA